VASEYRKAELKRFCRTPPGGFDLEINSKSRVIPLLLSEVPEKTWPPPLPRYTPVRFFDDKIARFTRTDHFDAKDPYWRRLETVARDVWTMLQILHILPAERSVLTAPSAIVESPAVVATPQPVRPANPHYMLQSSPSNQPMIFISYSHKDADIKQRLVTQLKVLQIADIFEDVWDDTRIQTGEGWFPEIKQRIEGANVAIMLISANFLTSPFILSDEVPPLLKRRKEEGILVFPILVKPVAWKGSVASKRGGHRETVTARQRRRSGEDLQRMSRSPISCRLAHRWAIVSSCV
jgi:hypothetical protein